MEQQTKNRTGLFKLLTVILSVLLVAAIVLGVLLYIDKRDLRDELSVLSSSNETLAADLDAMSETAQAAQDDLMTASQTIESMSADAAEATDTITYLETELAAAVAQGQTDLQAAQDEAVDAIATLQEDLATLQTEFDTYKSQAEADLAAAIAQAEADLQAAQTHADTTIASLEAELAQCREDAAAQTELSEAEDAAVVETTEAAIPYAPDTVIAMVAGQPLTGAEVTESYQRIVSYYGEPDAQSLELYYAVALEEAITQQLITSSAAQMQLDQFTDEERSALYADSDSEWLSALDNYVYSNFAVTDETAQEDLDAAYAQAETYYASMGYTQEILRQSYVDNALFTRLQDELCKDVTVSDEEVTTYFDETAQADAALYAEDLQAYENQLMMLQYGYADQAPWYKPEGIRYIKHILLPVDEELLKAYNDLVSLSEEEGSTVTDADIEAARGDILASVQATVDEINEKLAQGATFDEMIAAYGTDPGMANGAYPDGYELSQASTSYVAEFLQGALSLDAPGSISEPVLSQFGVHLIQYAGDVPSGPVELTADMQQQIRSMLLDEKCNELLAAWRENADVEYMGVLRTVEEIQGEQAQ